MEQKLCEYTDCKRIGDIQVYSRQREKTGWYCYDHYHIIAEEGSPEYIITCPACNCVLGVN